MPTICIPLLGKGATNHLHKPAIADEFRKRGYDVLFLVRDDYKDLLKPLEGCSYAAYTIPRFQGWVGWCFDLCLQLRYQYPSADPWRRWRHKTVCELTPRWTGRFFQNLVFALASSRRVMQFVTRMEGWLYRRFDNARDLDALPIDRLLVLGVGTWADNVASRITWWALRNNKPIVHFIGNYDGLSSKGFRGHPVRKVLVWGQRMKEDALHLQGIKAECVVEIGSLRYNMIPPRETRSKTAFFEKIGFDAAATTLAFAGSAYDYQYFEMLKVFELLKKQLPGKLQLILRVYPAKNLLDSPQMSFLINYARQQPDVWISSGDPNYDKRTGNEEVLQIDEDDLWNILQFSDVVVNIFSTLTLEACIFDKPVINMWYFWPVARALRQPIYYPYPETLHIRRVMESGAAPMAETRAQLVAAIIEAVNNPQALGEERRRLTIMECGVLDGRAVERLVDIVGERR
jgi:hypothetical protein